MTAMALGLVLPLLALPAAAQSPSDLAQLTPLEELLLADARDERLDDFSLIDAAFIASGLPDAQSLDRFRKSYRQLSAAAAKAIPEEGSQYERARELFSYLHAGPLKRYGLHAVDMVGLFSRGEYNCVSATILFNALLDDLEIPSTAVLVPSHVFSLVRPDGRRIEVETTSPAGFDPARTAEEYLKLLDHYRLAGATREEGSDAGRTRAALIEELEGERQEISNLTLVAIIYSNLAVARLADGDTASALACFLKADRLVRNSLHFAQSRDALLNNLVVEQIESGQFRLATATVRAAAAIPGLSRALLDRLTRWSASAWSQEALALEKKGRFQEALALYEEALKDLPGHALLLHNRKASWVAWGLAHHRAGEHREAATVMLAALGTYPEDAVVANNFLAMVQHYGRHLRDSGEIERAHAAARFALEQAGPLVARSPVGPGVLAGLRQEQGMALFALGDFAGAMAEFAAAMAGGDRTATANYLAAATNLARGQLLAKQPGEARTTVATALAAAGQAAALEQGFFAAYWAATLAWAADLREQGKAAAALRLLDELSPAGTLPANESALAASFAQLRSHLLLDLGRRRACLDFLAAQPEIHQGKEWFASRERACKALTTERE